ncbi:hypothetical protein KCV87_35440 [Actinosynnema pretiosum subsp. pretiosum]|uniref:Uncharacterized protein n=1 Tax=Actinosynnema pretiosum subsp. pretiosum TaxID=103721 RepID=A0AA45L826_9PSEU|nr:hypothetical protein APASM_4062 [Actinosynnema pretiosum subsp. pretiosum]QUF04528.1 hypothetical protein KCV87_35440 [Actinosynnema pretiosum subsp. pretiosum]
MTTSTTAARSTPRDGVLSGLAGGLVFGLLMAGMGALPMVGMLIAVDNALVGFVLHMAISAAAGAGFGALAQRLPDQVVPLYAAGVLYGVLWWAAGALLIMPLWLSATADPAMADLVLVVGDAQWVSLFGHVFFGLATAATLLALRGHAR